MKTIIFSILVLLLFSCEKSEYPTFLITSGIETIDSIAIYPNSPVLIADGKAQLTLMVKAFSKVQTKRTIEYVINDEHFVKDSVFTQIAEVKMDRIPADRIHIETTDGQKVENYTFSTDKGANSEIEFIGTINNVKTVSRKVRLIARPEMNFDSVTIPVVFHVLYTANNKVIAEGVTEKMVQGFINRANQVFGGTYANDPAAIDTKVRFKAATQNNRGAALATPGINRVNMGAKNVYPEDVTDYINNNLLWSPDKILNIWVSDADTEIEAYEPYYVLGALADRNYLKGLEYLEEVEADAPAIEYTTYMDLGIRYPLALIFDLNKANSGSSQHLEYYLGIHLGVIQTLGDNSYPDDYCSDTYSYVKGPRSREKYTDTQDMTAPVVYYNSYNIMDQYSASTSVTREQALRIREVISHCPSRMYR